MGKIKEELQAITAKCRVVTDAERVPNFFYGRKSEANVAADNEGFPAVVLIEPDEQGFILNTLTGNLYEADNCFIQFIDQRPMGETATDREATIRAMRNLAAQFIGKINQSRNININLQGATANIKGVIVVDLYDANCVGIEINLPLRTEYPNDIC